MERDLRVALALEVRDDSLPDETRVANQVEHFVEPVVKECELKAELSAVDGEHTRPALTVQAEDLLAAHSRYVDGHVERTDDARVAASQSQAIKKGTVLHCNVLDFNVQYSDTVFKWKLYTCELIPVGQRVLDVRGGRENQYVAIIPCHTLHTRALVHRRQDIQLSVANCDHCKRIKYCSL